ncbi:MAG: bifunctional adenosylcobinamide kinase/adenosylcobinamide-phosphate guanylyltransferase [Candidatus Latescibacteria bacterium]|nr:bifunctional adenosylcobinamide kinase/adenosylcobinamide-phosphate guanylyltransferase [Candidatus Latescibacterota bacterium]
MNEGELILILGGARAGKSTFALRLARERATSTSGRVCFIATAEALDDEMHARIVSHRAERPSHWQTIEEPKHLDRALSQARDADVVIVECLTLFASNWLLATEHESACEQEVTRIVEDFLAISGTQRQFIICVSNEVGLGLVPETSVGRAFRDVLGRMNQRFAQAADRVYVLVAGLPLQLKPGAPVKL